MSHDSTKRILTDALRQLQVSSAAEKPPSFEGLYLMAEDNQFLGEVSTSTFDTNSLANTFGPYGSRYSPTSIFNEYSDYGSQFGRFSIRNPYANQPPKLFRAGRQLAPVSKNPYIRDRIDADVFLAALRDPAALLGRNPNELAGIDGVRGMTRGFLEGQDGMLLGSLRPDDYDPDSVFNRYGQYGSKYSPQSIYNTYGKYGDRYSDLSAWNPSARLPPRIIVEGEFRAFLTANTALQPAVLPSELRDWAIRNVRKW